MENLHEESQEKSYSKPLPGLKIGKYSVESCIIQGGMGIGISMALLAGAVSLYGGIGTLSAAGLHLTDQYRAYRVSLVQEAKDKAPDHKLSKEDSMRLFKEANCYCIKEEIKKAKEIAQGKPVFINIMAASKNYNDLVRAACEAGVNGIVSGAGLPINLPELTKEYPDVALIPIVSDLRGTKLLLERYWMKHGKMPDAIVVEAPSKAGGHLGAKNIESVYREDAKLENSIPAIREYLDSLGLQQVPVIAAGGIDTREDIDETLALGANGVQMGTRFLATPESGANQEFKNAVVNAVKEDLVLILSSAGLPFRALKSSGTLTRVGGPKDRIAEKHNCDNECLTHCGYTAGDIHCVRMCILRELLRSTKGGRGLGLMSTGDFFDEQGNSKITSILPVKEIMEILQREIV